MSLKRTLSKASTKEPKMEQVELKQAWILPKELGDNLMRFLGELPYKFKRDLDPIVSGLAKSYRSDLTVGMSLPPSLPKGREGKEGEIPK